MDRELFPAAERAAEAFYDAKRSILGVQLPPPSKRGRNDRRWSDFVAIACICVDHGWDPSEYVYACVGRLSGNGPCLLPDDITVDSIVNWYAKEGGGVVDAHPEEEWAFANEALSAESGGDEELAQRLLLSPLSSFPSWFRGLRGSERVAEAWAEAAMSDINDNRPMKEWASERFPLEMKRLVKLASMGGAI